MCHEELVADTRNFRVNSSSDLRIDVDLRGLRLSQRQRGAPELFPLKPDCPDTTVRKGCEARRIDRRNASKERVVLKKLLRLRAQPSNLYGVAFANAPAHTKALE